MDSSPEQVSPLRAWLEAPLVTGLGASIPAGIAGLIFGESLQKPLLERISPEFVHLHQTLVSRLQLTAPLTLGVALILILWVRAVPDHSGLRMLASTAVLMATTWLGKTFAFGTAAGDVASEGGFVVENGHLVWQTNATGVLANELSGGMWTHGISLLLRYYVLYGPLQFFLSLGCGALLGGYWAWKLAQRD
ncbi:MAG: hypothetical protein NTV21_18235 [Planctomycetota bacterium]|nr:hypothetical protein [Planctomycetota bacterium]